MTEYVTGQIYGWNGGECPVHPKTKVLVWLRRGERVDVFQRRRHGAGDYSWVHGGVGGDIVCFQVITPYAEPKVIWVNECKVGYMTAHDSEEKAKQYSFKNHARIAVKYVEVKK